MKAEEELTALFDEAVDKAHNATRETVRQYWDGVACALGWALGQYEDRPE